MRKPKPASEYEQLMRQALGGAPWHPHRDNTKAAIYRQLELSHGRFTREQEATRQGQHTTWSKPLPELRADYEAQLRLVSDNVSRALRRMMEHYMSHEQRQQLEECRQQLVEPTMEALEAVVKQALAILTAAGFKERYPAHPR